MKNKQLKKEQLLKESIKRLIREELQEDNEYIENIEDETDDEFVNSAQEDLPINDPRVNQIIQMLKDIDVDGETMEYIIVKVGMEDQMAKQLAFDKAPYVGINQLQNEADEKKEDTEEFDINDEEETTDETDKESTDEESFDSDIDMSGLQGDTKELMAKLQDAMELARKTGDKKLVNQLGNTITFFARTHIARPEEQEALAEEIRKLQFKAGIIK
jgi:hypothetical protein